MSLTAARTLTFRDPTGDAVAEPRIFPPPLSERLSARAWLALVLVAVIVRLPALLFRGPIDDETVYTVVANAMLDGGRLYRDAIERKPPLLFGVYWGVFKVLGRYDWLALHLVALAWALATMIGLYAIAARLFGARAGFAAALVYAVLQPWATYKNLAFNGELLMNLPLVWAYAGVVRPEGTRPGMAAIASAGALLAGAFLLKQPAAIAAVPVGLYLLWLPGSWHQRWADAALLTAAFAVTLGVVAMALRQEGILGEAYYWTITDHDIPHIFWAHAAEHTALFALFTLPLLAPLALWRPLARAWLGQPAAFTLALGWLAVSAVGAAAGARFYPHYFIQLLPPLALLAAPVYARAPVPRLSPSFALAWLGLGAVVSVGIETKQLAAVPRDSAAARYVRVHSARNDRLFVWGQASQFYLEARRRPATRYIATFPLTGYIFGGPLGISTDDRIVPGAWANLASDFVAHPPLFIVDTQGARDAQYPMSRYPYLANLIAQHYRLVAYFTDADVYKRTGAGGY